MYLQLVERVVVCLCLQCNIGRGVCCAGGANFSVPVPGGSKAAEADASAGTEDELARAIVECEVHSSEWTLMHRYNKAAELIEGILQATPRPPSKYIAGSNASTSACACNPGLVLHRSPACPTKLQAWNT